MEDKKSFVSRLIVFGFLGFTIFISIYSAQKVTTLPKNIEKKTITPITLTPTPTPEENIFFEEESSISGELLSTPSSDLK